MIILGLDLAKVNWYLFGYVLASIFFLVYGTMQVYATGQIRGVIFAIGVLIILIYFGLRWFGSKVVKTTNWPPVINMCPDYLTYVPTLPGSMSQSKPRGTAGCVDLLGVSTSSVGIQKAQPSDLVSTTAINPNKIFRYTSADVKTAKVASDLQPICDACRSSGITWEGIYDGDVCVGISTIEGKAARAEQCLVSI
jgi:hypothetical protein